MCRLLTTVQFGSFGRDGREAEGNGLLNRHTGDFPYRGFESLSLRIFKPRFCGALLFLFPFIAQAAIYFFDRAAQKSPTPCENV